jgi:endonuclease/exonuclease/phosphatase family metal-dependent hydrolase
MKIYSWNMLFRNRELDRAFQFITESDFDVFCLQEVPEEFLKQLQTLPYSIAFRAEREIPFKKGVLYNYIVILTKHLITTEGEISHQDYWPLLPRRARLFIRLMPLFSKMESRKNLYADITIRGTSVRIFNLHLILMHPTLRLKEFETAMAERDSSRPTIVCGDFNILEAPHITILNWLLGGQVNDTFLWTRERTHIEKRFVSHELSNPLRGKSTHPLSRSQLDHILVSHSFSIKNADVLSDRIGSDHHPIRVEVA